MADVSPLYAATRRALLDALDVLASQHDGLVLVGAQAIFLHTGDVDEAIATETKCCGTGHLERVRPHVVARQCGNAHLRVVHERALDAEHPAGGHIVVRRDASRPARARTSRDSLGQQQIDRVSSPADPRAGLRICEIEVKACLSPSSTRSSSAWHSRPASGPATATTCIDYCVRSNPRSSSQASS